MNITYDKLLLNLAVNCKLRPYTEALIYPKDEFGNLQDYRVEKIDGLAVAVTINGLYTVPVTLTPKVDATAVVDTVFYSATFAPMETGAYIVNADFLRPDGTRKKAGGVLRTSTRPTFNRLTESARPYEHSP